MSRQFVFVLTIFYTLIPSRSFALDLAEIYQLARTSDPEYKQVVAANGAILERRAQALSGLLPSATLSANTITNDQDIKLDGFGASGKASFNSHGYSLDVTQPLFRLDRYFELKQADSIIRQADAELSSAEQDLMVRVATAYFDVLAAKDNLAFAKAETKSLKKQLEQARQRFDVGLTAITDVQEAQAGYDLAFSQQIVAENEIDNASESLRAITGEYISNLAALGEDMPLLNPQPAEIDVWTDTALKQNLSILATQSAVETARKEIKLQKSGHLPTLDLVARRDFASSGGRFGQFLQHSTSVGVQLNVPLYQGGFVSSKTREAHKRLEQEIQRLEQVRRRTQQLTRQAYLGVISGISQVKALSQAVISSETALSSTQAGFEVGTRTAVDVVTSERATFQAKRNYSRSRYNYILDSLRLKLAAGTLSDQDLTQVSLWMK